MADLLATLPQRAWTDWGTELAPVEAALEPLVEAAIEQWLLWLQDIDTYLSGMDTGR